MLVVSGMTGGCTNRPYSSPQEQAANACQALGPKALSGALIGGLGGAAAGAAIGGAAGGGRGAGIGALAGLGAGLIGGFVVGKQLDQQDCIQAQAALQQVGSAGVGQAVYWTNPATGSHGAYTPVSATYDANGQVCRQVRADYYMKNHQPVTGDTGVVCRTPEGDWVRQTAPQ
jgi:predicted lipid-binding transport protein (Tim44 family)